MKCKQCGHWNSIEVEKVMLNPDSREPKVRVFLPSYLPMKVELCSKCKSVIAQANEAIRIIKR